MKLNVAYPTAPSTEQFTFKPVVKVNHYSTWFSDVEIKLNQHCIRLTDENQNTYWLNRSYHKFNNPASWNLELEVTDINEKTVRIIPKLTFPIYDWIEDDVYHRWIYSSVEDLKTEMRHLAWDIIDEWENIMTPSLEKVLRMTIDNEIEHQIERFKSDIDEMIAKYNAGELAEVE